MIDRTYDFSITRNLYFLLLSISWNKRDLVIDRIKQHRHPSHYYHRNDKRSQPLLTRQLYSWKSLCFSACKIVRCWILDHDLCIPDWQQEYFELFRMQVRELSKIIIANENEKYEWLCCAYLIFSFYKKFSVSKNLIS